VALLYRPEKLQVDIRTYNSKDEYRGLSAAAQKRAFGRDDRVWGRMNLTVMSDGLAFKDCFREDPDQVRAAFSPGLKPFISGAFWPD
jgi:hypothetical protein